MNVFIPMLSDAELEFTGFFDGRQRLIPNNTELEIMITGGTIGANPDTGMLIAEVYLVVSEKGEYLGQKYTWKPKVFDTDDRKRDLAVKNLAQVDRYVGFPIVKANLPLNEQTIAQYWTNKARAIALFRTNEEIMAKNGDTGNPINYIAGMRYATPKAQPAVEIAEEDIGF